MDRQNLQNSIDEYQQRIFIKFGVLLGWSAIEIDRNLRKALNKQAYPSSSIRRWFGQIKNGRIDVKEARGGNRNNDAEKENQVEKIKELLSETRNWSLRTIEHITGIPHETVRKILKDKLGLNKVYKIWIPYQLNEEQKLNRIIACQANLLRFKKTNSLLRRTLAIDESWIRMYEPAGHSNKIWLHPSESREVQVKGGFQQKKRMLMMAMDYNGIAFWKLLDEKVTVTSKVYKEFIEEHIEEWKIKNSIKCPVIVHDNARSHVSRLVQDFFVDEGISVWIQPPYSPDIQPCDFNCFGPLKGAMKGNRYINWNDVETALKNAIESGLSRGLYQGVKMLPERWERVIAKEGDYI